MNCWKKLAADSANIRESAATFFWLVLLKFEIQAKLLWKVITTDAGTHDDFVCFTDKR